MIPTLATVKSQASEITIVLRIVDLISEQMTKPENLLDFGSFGIIKIKPPFSVYDHLRAMVVEQFRIAGWEMSWPGDNQDIIIRQEQSWYDQK